MVNIRISNTWCGWWIIIVYTIYKGSYRNLQIISKLIHVLSLYQTRILRQTIILIGCIMNTRVDLFASR